MSVVHSVLFKLKDPSQTLEKTVETLRAMEGKIDVLKSLEVGVDQLKTPRSYHIALIARFEGWPELETYRTHPLHATVLQHMAEVTEHSAVVDYET